jgi:hypothetical protein
MNKIISMRGRRGQVPEGSVYVGRAMRWVGVKKSKWANPFKIGPDGTREEVKAKYHDWLLTRPELVAALPELRDKDLACWSADTCCHTEVLLKLANE